MLLLIEGINSFIFIRHGRNQTSKAGKQVVYKRKRRLVDYLQVTGSHIIHQDCPAMIRLVVKERFTNRKPEISEVVTRLSVLKD